MGKVDVLSLPRVKMDFETRSVLKLPDTGAWRYAEHPLTDILSMAYKVPFSDPTPKLWIPSQPFPQDMISAVENGWAFEAHNSQFEMAIWACILRDRMGIPMPTRWVDTLATCAYRAIPLGLDEVGRVLNLDVKKDKRGKYLIQKLCQPRKPLKADKEMFAALELDEEDWPLLWNEDPELLEELYDYNIRDVETEEDLGECLGDMSPQEYGYWTMDQRINVRGVQIDIEAVKCAIGIIETLKDRYEGELYQITDGSVDSAGKVAKMRAWLLENGYEVDNLQAETVEESIQAIKADIATGEYPEEWPTVLRVLEIRAILGSSSIKKLYKLRESTCDDGRARGMLQYHGAGTGRWSGRLAQPQNIPRGNLEEYCETLGLGEDECMDLLIDTIKLGGEMAIEGLEILFGDVTEAIISSLRGMFTVAPGKVMRVADFSAIEAVVNAWLAGEEWKLEAFRGIQRGEGYKGSPDIYCATASEILGKPVNKKTAEGKQNRQRFGKVPELAFGYQGGEGAWYNFDRNTTLSSAEINSVKDAWREKHPAICSLWYGVEEAAIDAMKFNKRVSYRNVSFETVVDSAGKWLTAILPNGKRLWYFNPILLDSETPWGKPTKVISYEGRDNKKGGRWGRVETYGGMLTENIVQAISRELMAEAMVRVEKAGYSMILTVHDEIATEDDPEHGSMEEFESLMSIVPDWAEGCPVGVDGWEGTRYRK